MWPCRHPRWVFEGKREEGEGEGLSARTSALGAPARCARERGRAAEASRPSPRFRRRERAARPSHPRPRFSSPPLPPLTGTPGAPLRLCAPLPSPSVSSLAPLAALAGQRLAGQRLPPPPPPSGSSPLWGALAGAAAVGAGAIAFADAERSVSAGEAAATPSGSGAGEDAEGPSGSGKAVVGPSSSSPPRRFGFPPESDFGERVELVWESLGAWLEAARAKEAEEGSWGGQGGRTPPPPFALPPASIERDVRGDVSRVTLLLPQSLPIKRAVWAVREALRSPPAVEEEGDGAGREEARNGFASSSLSEQASLGGSGATWTFTRVGAVDEGGRWKRWGGWGGGRSFSSTLRVTVEQPFDASVPARVTISGSPSPSDVGVVVALASAVSAPASLYASPRSPFASGGGLSPEALEGAFEGALDAGLGHLLGSVFRGLEDELSAAGIPTFGVFDAGWRDFESIFGPQGDDGRGFASDEARGGGRGDRAPGEPSEAEAEAAARWIADAWSAAARAARAGGEGRDGEGDGDGYRDGYGSRRPRSPYYTDRDRDADDADEGGAFGAAGRDPFFRPPRPSSPAASARARPSSPEDAEDAEAAAAARAAAEAAARDRRLRRSLAREAEAAEAKLSELGARVYWPPETGIDYAYAAAKKREEETERKAEEGGQGAKGDSGPSSASSPASPSSPDPFTVDWGELVGYESQKRIIEETALLWIAHPEAVDRVARGTRARPSRPRPRALLLEGPPGTGKTSAARVLAARAGVPLVVVPLEALGSKWYGEAEKRLADALAAARAMPAPGCLLFLDELDSLAGRRGGDMHEATRRQLGVLLRELDGFDASERRGEGQDAGDKRRQGAGEESLADPAGGAAAPPAQKNLLVIGATNRAVDLDPALLSRFATVVTFGLPDAPTRAEILAAYARQLSQADRETLAGLTDGMAGRDLRALCETVERAWAAKQVRGLEPPGSLPNVQAYERAVEARKDEVKRAQESHWTPPGGAGGWQGFAMG